MKEESRRGGRAPGGSAGLVSMAGLEYDTGPAAQVRRSVEWTRRAAVPAFLPAKGPTVKIQVQQPDLVRALGAVANVVSSKTTLPILSTILFDATKSGLTLAATDLDVSVVTKIGEVEVEKDGKAAIPASKFVAFARTLGADPVVIKASGEKVSVTCGRARLEEPCMAPEDFPSLPSFGEWPRSRFPARSSRP